MKIIKNLIPVLLFICTLVSCEKSELMTYSEKDNIYFYESMLPYSYQIKDTTNIPFAYYPEEMKDTTITIRVQIMGKPSNVERHFKVVANDSSTAIAGIHYEALQEGYPIPADSIYGYVNIKMMRAPDLRNNIVKLIVSLQPNEDFNTNMTFRTTNLTTGAGVSTVNYKIIATDILLKPFRWSDAFFGNFSRKKCLLICELVGISPSYLNGEPNKDNKTISPADAPFYGLYVQRYLNDQAHKGNVILDEDGEPMVMGPSSQ